MKPGQTCETCNCYSILDETCHFNPPKPFPMPKPNGQFAVLGLFPYTRKDNWCMKWSPSIIQ